MKSYLSEEMMAKVEPFERFTQRYEEWFEKHRLAYLSELRAVDMLLPENRERCVEIGVGTGRFAVPLGIKYGVEPSKKMAEIARKRGIRVLKKEGYIVIGFIDRKSPLGKYYQSIKDKNPFYREARFISTDELVEIMKKISFRDFRFVQTVFHRLDEIKEIEPVKEGYGEGSFVVVRARK